MSYEVAIVADSIGPNQARLTTFKLKYPRMIHAEFMTHRMFSRNASSTRAIPVSKMLEWVEKDPAMPIYWGKNQKGMVATEELDEVAIHNCQCEWREAKMNAVLHAKSLMQMGIHKQIASRLLEPFAHINVVLTSTSFDNFFALRCHKAAMPECQKLAVMMARAYRDSVPEFIGLDYWHLPFVTEDEIYEYGDEACLPLSVARCARVSYETFEGLAPDFCKDYALHDQLRDNGHWSPFEHQGQSQPEPHQYRSGNFLGWRQYRQTLNTSVHERFDYSTLDQFGDRDFIV